MTNDPMTNDQSRMILLFPAGEAGSLDEEAAAQL
jgi:hypothetical protein